MILVVVVLVLEMLVSRPASVDAKKVVITLICPNLVRI